MTVKNITGLKELQAMLNSLPAKLEGNIMRTALRAGAKVILEEAKLNVPIRHGDLRDSIRISTRIKKGRVTASVKAGNKKAWYWRFVEYGTAEHAISAKDKGVLSFDGFFGKSVLHPGAKEKPFMRPALDVKSSEAIVAVGEAIKKRLTKQGLDATDIFIEVEE